MAVVSPGEALEREHREIDAGIEPFSSLLSQHRVQPGPLLHAPEALRRHIYLEAEFLFPPLYAAGMTMPLWQCFASTARSGTRWKRWNRNGPYRSSPAGGQDNPRAAVRPGGVPLTCGLSRLPPEGRAHV